MKPLWRPITTAPKDGTRVLVIGKDGEVAICRWAKGRWEGRGYRSYTHWMPLPDPPAVVETCRQPPAA